MEILYRMAEAIYGDRDPYRILFKGYTQTIEKQDDSPILSIMLPFSSKEELSLLRSGEEMVIQVGGIRRNILLPHILIDRDVTSAKLEDNKLKIRFGIDKKQARTVKEKGKQQG